MNKVQKIDAFTNAVVAQCEARDAQQERGEVAAAAGYHSPLATSAAMAGTQALVRNLADGMRAGDWDGYAARHKLENVHRHLIDWSLEPGCSDARWQALKDARQIVTRAIMGMCR